MKNILFRGKKAERYYFSVTELDEWVYGFVYEETLDIEDGLSWAKGTFIKQPYGDHYQDFEVVFKTVGQYINRKDKKDIKIFTDDKIKGSLIEWNVPIAGVVVFDFEWSTYGLKNEAGLTPLSRISNIEIVGNIHDNTE